MSSKKFVPAMQINLRASRYLLSFILISHSGALVLLFLLPIAWWLIVLLVIAVLLSLYWQWREHVRAYKSLRWNSLDQWWLVEQGVVGG